MGTSFFRFVTIHMFDKQRNGDNLHRQYRALHAVAQYKPTQHRNMSGVQEYTVAFELISEVQRIVMSWVFTGLRRRVYFFRIIFPQMHRIDETEDHKHLIRYVAPIADTISRPPCNFKITSRNGWSYLSSESTDNLDL